MIAVALSILALAPVSPEPAACLVRPPWRLEGESLEQAFARQELERQSAAFRQADAIYLVETVEPEPESWSSQGVVVSVLRGEPSRGLVTINSPPCARTYAGGIRLVALYGRDAEGVLQPIGTFAPEALRDAGLIALYGNPTAGRDQE
ncbi:MAG: hypothetical protein KJ676_04265 [Alphaproteobacteria bacterium]|nr:hypothetical protein [Alphaproteobacteria bacterium]MBU1526898.1 hypothetical protein [Alphaproteobacteria bacterium]MBU2116945.1 hypothetical protein [Alphaproteobacteria bacterium]MBU2351816.1 hypothetical protein [Alphaproteobacteria bacterium]MBU2383774.1 hypothetical protein [Alphaproteobacteria bacterium]